MGYPGSSLDDYYSYQLIEKVIDQINNNDTGDVKQLLAKTKDLNKAVEKLKVKKGS